MNEEIDIILSRYFCGEATKKELHTLDVWLSKSDENEKYFHQMTLLYQYSGQAKDLPAIDTEQALAQFKNYMYENQKDNSKKFFKISRPLKAVATIAILLVSAFSLFYFINQPSKTIRLLAAETQKEYKIFENTDVTLFPGAEIIYKTKEKHKLQLKGKATFKVDSKISGAAITVQAGETYIEDIGTVFTIDATNPDKLITVHVAEGEVLFYTDINAGIRLNAGENAVYDVQTKQFKIVETGHVETGCAPSLPQEIVFQNTPFPEAINFIKARFGVDIIVNSNELNDVFLNVNFAQDESVDYILEIITATIPAKLSKKNNTYIITPLLIIKIK